MQTLSVTPAIPLPTVRQHLQRFDFRGLFNELGWDRLPETLAVDAGGETYTLHGVAEKRGFQVYLCRVDTGVDAAAGALGLNRAQRLQIDREVTRRAREHLLIFVDAAQTLQIWHWAERQPGQPIRTHEQEFRRGQTGEGLAQRLQRLFVAIEEDDESLTVLDISGRVRGSMAAERVTRRFYERFKQEHEAFREFVAGIQAGTDRDWYASLMLNRLMFVYFIQKKGFLDNDSDYLRHKLADIQQNPVTDSFFTFYRRFLVRLFHEGLSRQTHERDPELDRLIGRVPYLNGGLFDVHDLERQYPAIDIPDDAFARLFDFFDAYRWHLDERPLRLDDEINPDVLGYIFEKYINQKQMGAYYTKEDITEYIGKNTIIPAILDRAKDACTIAFRPDGALWGLLRDDPDRYIYPAVRKGMDQHLPPAIAAGLNDVTQRGEWNRPAASDVALPTETWREHVARRQRYEETWLKLAEGEVTSVDDLITLNLDIRQFAQDAIARCEGPETLRAFWQALASLSVLDPTCGSGAFLFAALNILQPLAAECLDRMQAFVAELDRPGNGHGPGKYSDFRKILERVDAHPNREYFVLKQIVLNNLYGVDIMAEAVEICKLRLFLKLVAQLEDANQIEPLPDIDFNIRTGNTLVGFVSLDEVERALSMSGTQQLRMIDAATRDDLSRMQEEADKAARASARFREMQDTSISSADLRAAKRDVRERLGSLGIELDRLQARLYGIDPSRADYEEEYGKWKASHQPFHWLSEFYEIVHNRGGFDVIIGNPPWAEYSTVRRNYRILGYKTERCGNLYGFCSERSLQILDQIGRFSFIVQLPLVSSPRMQSVRDLFATRAVHASTFDDRPGKLFDGLQHCRSTIVIAAPARAGNPTNLHTTQYQRWPTSRRTTLFELVEYTPVRKESIPQSCWPKNSSAIHLKVMGRLAGLDGTNLGSFVARQGANSFIFYQESAQYWIKVASHIPFYARNGCAAAPAHGRFLHFDDEGTAEIGSAILNSSLFYLYFISNGDCFHVNDGLVREFRVSNRLLHDSEVRHLNAQLMSDLRQNSVVKEIQIRGGDTISYAEYYASESKPIIDEIDRVLARHYGFTEEELDFIINYDIKYRMGRDSADDEA